MFILFLENAPETYPLSHLLLAIIQRVRIKLVIQVDKAVRKYAEKSNLKISILKVPAEARFSSAHTSW